MEVVGQFEGLVAFLGARAARPQSCVHLPAAEPAALPGCPSGVEGEFKSTHHPPARRTGRRKRSGSL